MIIDYLNEEQFDKYILNKENKVFFEEIFSKLLEKKELTTLDTKDKLINSACFWINEFSLIMVQMFKEKLKNTLISKNIKNKDEFILFISNTDEYENFLNSLFTTEYIQISNNFFINQNFYMKYLEMLSFLKLYFKTGFKNILEIGIFDEDLFTDIEINVDNILLHAGMFLNYNIRNREGQFIEVFSIKKESPLHYLNFYGDEEIFFNETVLPKIDYSSDIKIDKESVELFETLIVALYNYFYIYINENGKVLLHSAIKHIEGNRELIFKYMTEELSNYNIMTFLSLSNHKDLISFQALLLLNKKLPFEYKISIINTIIHYIDENKETIKIEDIRDFLEIFASLVEHESSLFVIDTIYNFASNFENETLLTIISQNPNTRFYITNKNKQLDRNFTQKDIDVYFEHLKNSRGFIYKISSEVTNEEIDDLFLLDLNYNIQDIRGFTPLIIASFVNNEYLVQKLLEKNVNVNAVNLSDKTALDYAVLNNNSNIVQKLLEDKHIRKNIVLKTLYMAQSTNQKINENIIDMLNKKIKE